MKMIKDIGIIKRGWHSRSYRYGHFLCPVCNEVVEKILKDGKKAKCCSHECYAKSRKKRGPYKKKIVNKKYVYIYKPEHPHAVGTRKLYVAEHRLVMERHVGRYLEANEVVHHVDGDTMNNKIENLQLMTASEHSSHHAATKKKGGRVDNSRFKFRAWDILIEKMYELTGFDIYDDEDEQDDLYKPMIRLIGNDVDENLLYGRIKLMQYTGLKDKNGKEIYEGDVCRFGLFALNDFRFGDVPWENLPEGVLEDDITTEHARFQVVMDFKSLLEIKTRIEDNPDVEGVEVIGNIWENPELKIHQEG